MVRQARLSRGGTGRQRLRRSRDRYPRARTLRAVLLQVGKCTNPNFRDAGLAVAQVDLWIIDYMAAEKRIMPKDVIVVGQSAGGWASIALSSVNPPQVKAIITFAAGRGGRVGGKPNNNCAPDRLVEATADFGRTSRVPMLWIYIENDTFFGPDLSKRMHQAFTAAGGKAEYHLDAAVRQRRTFPYRLARLHPALVAAGGEVSGRAEIEADVWRARACDDATSRGPSPSGLLDRRNHR